jgi:hypothetical protein
MRRHLGGVEEKTTPFSLPIELLVPQLPGWVNAHIPLLIHHPILTLEPSLGLSRSDSALLYLSRFQRFP